MLLKKGNIVMFRSKEQPVSVVIGEENVMSYDIGSLVFNPSAQPPLCMVTKDKAYSDTMGFEKVHLYLFIEGIVEEDDLILNELYCAAELLVTVNKMSFSDGDEFKKLVASTDDSLDTARFPSEFIDKFVEDNSINDVLVIHEELKEGVIVPIINKDNIISLSNKKDNYSNVEVVELFHKFFEAHDIAFRNEELIWIDKNV